MILLLLILFLGGKLQRGRLQQMNPVQFLNLSPVSPTKGASALEEGEEEEDNRGSLIIQHSSAMEEEGREVSVLQVKEAMEVNRETSEERSLDKIDIRVPKSAEEVIQQQQGEEVMEGDTDVKDKSKEPCEQSTLFIHEEEEMRSEETMAESIFQEEEEKNEDEEEGHIVQEQFFVSRRQSEGSASVSFSSEDNNVLNCAFSESMEESGAFASEEECEEEPALTPLGPQPVSIQQKSVVSSIPEKSPSSFSTTRMTRQSSYGLNQASGEDEEKETADIPLNVVLVDSPPPEDAAISIFSSRYLEEEQDNANHLLLEKNASLEENNEQGIAPLAPAGESLFDESIFQTSFVEYNTKQSSFRE
jgi:hypothetical protein